MKERLSIFLHNTVVSRNKWQQCVTSQLLETLHLIF